MNEKLIEIVCEMWHTDRCVAGCNFPPCYEVRYFVDNLIGNGVTIPILCKECKFCKNDQHGELYCNRPHDILRYVKPDDYCSWGKERGSD